MEFHERLTKLRNHFGYTQKELAKKIGVSLSTYIKYERNERTPKFNTLFLLSAFFDVSLDYLLCNPFSEKQNLVYSEESPEDYRNINLQLERISKNIENISEIENIQDGAKEQIQQFLKIISDTLESKHDPAETNRNNDLIYLLNQIYLQLMEIYENHKIMFNDSEQNKINETWYYSRVEISKRINEMMNMMNDFLAALEIKEYYNLSSKSYFSFQIFQAKDDKYNYI